MNRVLIYIGFVMPYFMQTFSAKAPKNVMSLLKKAIAERAGILLPTAEGGKKGK
jgi:hypothetical protein